MPVSRTRPDATSYSSQHHHQTKSQEHHGPQQQQQQQPSTQHSHRHDSEQSPIPAAKEAASNILTSSYISPSAQPDNQRTNPVGLAALRPAKFTEEWDASQRGSSILDGPAHGSTNMHRSNSFSGSIAAGEGSSSLSRGNTLKKKPSLRRGGSLKRSGSNRSMKARSVRSLALQSNGEQDEVHSAFYCPVPTAGDPTGALANRFQGLSIPGNGAPFSRRRFWPSAASLSRHCG
jgi:hypothetical protein